MSYRSSGSFSLVCRQVPGLRVTAARSSLLTATVVGRCSSTTAPSPLTRCASAFSSLSCSSAATGFFSTTATSGGGASSSKTSFLKQKHSTCVLLSAPCTKTTTATMNFGMLLQFLNTEEDDDGC